MGLLDTFRRREHVDLIAQQLYEAELELEELAETWGFSWPRDRAKVERIQRDLDRGDSFAICKQLATATGGKLTRAIVHTDGFPSPEEIEDLVYDTYGGGRYLVFGGGDRSRVVRTVTIQGESKTPETPSNGQKQSTNTIKAQLESVVSERLTYLLAANPELADRAALGLLEKSLKVNLNGNQTDPVEAVIKALKQGEEIRDALGSNSGPWGVLSEVAKSILPAVPQVRQMIEAGNQAQRNNQGRPVIQSPRPQPQIKEPQPHELSQVSGQVPRNETEESRVMGISNANDEPTPQNNGGEGQIDWASILLHTDWVDLEKRVNGNPRSFLDWLVAEYNAGSQGAAVLLNLFANTPEDLVTAVTNGFANLSNTPWAMTVARAAGKGDDLEAGRRIVEHFNSDAGLQWVRQVHELLQRMQGADDGQGQTEEEDSIDPEAARREWLEEQNRLLDGKPEPEPVATIPYTASQNGHEEERLI